MGYLPPPRPGLPRSRSEVIALYVQLGLTVAMGGAFLVAVMSWLSLYLDKVSA